MIGTLHWSDCVHLSKVAWELAAYVLSPLVHSTPRPVSPDQGLINTIPHPPEVTDLPTRYVVSVDFCFVPLDFLDWSVEEGSIPLPHHGCTGERESCDQPILGWIAGGW